MSRRLNGKMKDVLKQVMARLIDQRARANKAAAYLTLDVNNFPSSNPGTFIYGIQPGEGSFDDANWDGGGQSMATTVSQLTVRVSSPMALDQQGRDTAMLTHDTLSILDEWEEVIKCLTVEDWSPEVEVDGETIIILRDPLIPTTWAFGETILDSGKPIGWAQQTFRLSFDLDLS